MTKKHNIQKKTFEISYDNPENALVFQQEISQLIKQKLARLTEDILDEFAPKDVIFRINALEIDLGKVQYKQMENDISHKFKYALRDAIQKASIEAKTKTSINAEFIIPNFALIDVFLLYLTSGILPWWAESSLAEITGQTQDKIEKIEDILKILLKKSPDLLKEIYLSNANNKKIIKRSIAQFSDKSIFAIFRLFLATQETFVKTIYTQIVGIQQKTIALNIDFFALRKTFFETIFSEILLGNPFNPEGQKQIVEKILFALAFVNKTSTYKFWEAVYESSQKKRLNQVLEEVIQENYQIYQKKKFETIWQDSDSLETFTKSTQVLKTFSEESVKEILTQIYPNEAKAIWQFIAQLLKYLPQKIAINNLQKLNKEILEFILEYLWQQQRRSFLNLEELFLVILENVLEIYAKKTDKEKIIVEMAREISTFTEKSEEILAFRAAKSDKPNANAKLTKKLSPPDNVFTERMLSAW